MDQYMYESASDIADIIAAFNVSQSSGRGQGMVRVRLHVAPLTTSSWNLSGMNLRWYGGGGTRLPSKISATASNLQSARQPKSNNQLPKNHNPSVKECIIRYMHSKLNSCSHPPLISAHMQHNTYIPLQFLDLYRTFGLQPLPGKIIMIWTTSHCPPTSTFMIWRGLRYAVQHTQTGRECHCEKTWLCTV